MSCVAFYYWYKYIKLTKHINKVKQPEQQWLNAKKIIEANGYRVVVNAIEIKSYTDIQL
jgi:hypothetical protein